jgi:exosome complex component RRP45
MFTHRHQHSPSERAPVPLSLQHTPFCLTFAFFPDPGTPPILDANLLEQRLSAGLLSIAINAQREMCVLQKAGGVPLSVEEILGIVNVAAEKAKELDEIVERALKVDLDSRHVEFR